MHGGNDVQQVEGVTVGAASEQVLARPRHRAGRVVAVVDGREDDAGGAVARRWMRPLLGRVVPEVDVRHLGGGCSASARVGSEGKVGRGKPTKLTEPSDA